MTATRAIQLLLVGTLSAGAVAVSAGGWAVLTIVDVPDQVVAGEPFDLTFALRAHGRALVSGLSAFVEAESDARSTRAVAEPSKEAGHYTATLVLPSPGNWTLAIQTAYGQGQTVRLPLKAIANGAVPPGLGEAERGERLFVAKGCMTCHRHEAVASNHPSPVGPPLGNTGHTREFVQWRLRQGGAVSASPAGTFPWSMPDLKLTPAEIDALAAFLEASN